MKTVRIIAVAAALALMAACGRNEVTPDDIQLSGEQQAVITNAGLPDEDFCAGVVNVKVTPDFAKQLESNTGSDGFVNVDKVSSMGFAVSELGIISMTRLFPYAGRFEERTREAGLHLWYRIRYDESHSVTKAGNDLSFVNGIAVVDYEPQIVPAGGNVVTERVAAPQTAPAGKTLPFDDPYLSDQWHYYNDGSIKGSQSGCDINVVPIWNTYTTGNKDVIVSVVDGGIDYEHEDLADNMWHDPEDARRVGYNFCTDNYVITPHDHGTHVAGTVAAVNNNGKGVCGVAGGNAALGKKGVSLMSCQIFSNDGKSGSGAAAIKWGADHGAVISQNSWGYTSPSVECPDALKAAVDYFVKYGGMDETGKKQVGPMAGGIVIFAAGNDNSETPYGTAYEKILSVSSVSADYCRAYYSNYGDWCNVAAPGGDYKKGAQVLSTLPGNSYGKMQGTSMACPHVSGIAALIVSYKGGQGYTNKALWDAIVNNTTDISAYNRSTYLGTGLVNTYKAIAGSGGKAPDKVEDFSLVSRSNNIDVTIKVPADQDDDKPNTLVVYYSTSQFTSTEGLMFTSIYVGDAKVGSYVKGTITGLDFSKKYYVAVVACDLGGNKSNLSDRKTVTTGINHAPVFSPAGPVSLTIKRHETKQVKFTVSDPDDHFVSVSLKPGHMAERLDTTITDAPFLEICGPYIEAGNYHSTIVGSDIYGASTELKVDYTVLENHKPQVSSDIPDYVFGKRGETIELKDDDYFIDPDGEALTYIVENDNESVVNVNHSQGKLFLTSMGYGYAVIKITASDCLGEYVEQSFQVLVRDGNEPVDIYPNPVSNTLYVRTSEDATVNLKVISVTGAVAFEKEVGISPFSPAALDVSGIAAGVYTVKLEYGGKTLTKNIVKI